MSSTDADVVVVGGGHNGLVCAGYLARAGLDTLIVEARSSIGGCASTVWDLGARFNICNCDHTLVRAMPFIDELDLEAHGLRYLEADPTFVHLAWDDTPPVLMFHDSERTIDSIARHRPAAVEGYRRYLADAAPVVELLLAMAATPATTPKFLEALVRRGGRGAVRLLQWSRASLLDVLANYFDDEAMILPAVATGPSVWGVPPDAPGTGLAATLYALRHHVKAGRPEGGSGALTDAMRRAFECAGGRVRCRATVQRIMADRDTVFGVALEDGTEIRTDCVVASCDPRTVAATWLSEEGRRSGRYVRSWRSRPERDGYVSKIDAVVTDAPRYRAIDGCADLLGNSDPNDPTVVISPSLAELDEAHRLRAQGRVAHRPSLMSNVPSVLDPTMRSTDGHHVLSLEVVFTPYALEGGWPGSDEPSRWLEEWATLVQPGYLHAVERYRVMTPDRYESEFHMPRGYTSAYDGSPLQSLVGLRRDLSRHRTPVRGLFLAGAGTYPGAGVWGASGRNAAAAVLRASQRHHKRAIN